MDRTGGSGGARKASIPVVYQIESILHGYGRAEICPFVKHPRLVRRQIHAAMRPRFPEVVMPVGAMDGGATAREI